MDYFIAIGPAVFFQKLFAQLHNCKDKSSKKLLILILGNFVICFAAGFNHKSQNPAIRN
jgi:hypothetical protein